MDLAITLTIVLASGIWVLARWIRNVRRALGPSCGCTDGATIHREPAGFVPASALLRRCRRHSRPA